MADDYEHDVFISYRRSYKWPDWVKNTFMPIFEHWLECEKPGAKIFIDNQIETGSNWPTELAEALSKSKVLVGLWCRPYFTSKWCLKELSLIYAREKKFGFGTPKNSQRLIIPASIHDGEGFPKKVQIIKPKQLQNYSGIHLADGSKKKEELDDNIRTWMPDIVKAIDSAPHYDPKFSKLAYKEFMKVFKCTNNTQKKVPNIGK